LAGYQNPGWARQIGSRDTDELRDCCMNATITAPASRTALDDQSRGEATPSAKTGPVSGMRLGARHGLWAIGVLLCVGVGIWGVRYWTFGRFIESTDDAYVKADSTTVSPKVSGYIAQVLVEDNEPVRAGQVLARIDDRDLQTALHEANANVAAAAAVVANLTAQLTVQDYAIREAQADLEMAQTAAGLAQRNDARRREMAKVGFGSNEQSDEATTDFQHKTASIARAQAALASAGQQVEVLQTQRQLAEAQRLRALANQTQAELNLSYATVRAAINGTVGARTLRVGQFVQAGTQLMEIVPLRNVYVVANFKETQLTRMRPGQPVRLSVDAFAGEALRGHVDSLAPASGLEFALLPPDNATGNFTKIVQRVPIKVVLDDPRKLAGRLRPGMSVDVAVDTRHEQPSAAVRQEG
jgi:membrane fusion protein, multidrug efflux system